MKNLLIVDDEKEQLEVMEHLLKEDFDLLFAESGESAAKILEKKQVDLIISDLEMPQGDGFWLLNHLKLHYPKKVPVIIVSGSTSIDSLKIINSGASFFLPKPIDYLKLINLITILFRPSP